MIRKLLAAAVTAGALLAFAPPAQAAVVSGGRVPTPIVFRDPPVAPPNGGAPYPLCVTTIWRSKHTHRPKTRPGATCLLSWDMWLPRSWRVLGVWETPHNAGQDGLQFLVVQRPRVR